MLSEGRNHTISAVIFYFLTCHLCCWTSPYKYISRCACVMCERGGMTTSPYSLILIAVVRDMILPRFSSLSSSFSLPLGDFMVNAISYTDKSPSTPTALLVTVVRSCFFLSSLYLSQHDQLISTFANRTLIWYACCVHLCVKSGLFMRGLLSDIVIGFPYGDDRLAIICNPSRQRFITKSRYPFPLFKDDHCLRSATSMEQTLFQCQSPNAFITKRGKSPDWIYAVTSVTPSQRVGSHIHTRLPDVINKLGPFLTAT